MKKRFIKLTVTIMCLLFALNINALAATKKGTVYENIIKKGNFVYCSTGNVIYKVNLNTGKVKKLVKVNIELGLEDMKLRGNWLYFNRLTPATGSLCRVNVSTGKKQVLAKDDDLKISGNKYGSVFLEKYVIIGKKIYCKSSYMELNDKNKDGTLSFVMNINGKKKKKANVRINMKKEKTTTQGYYIETDSKYRSYLRTPSKIYFLRK